MAVNYKDIPELLKMHNLDGWRVRRYNKDDTAAFDDDGDGKKEYSVIFKSNPELSFDENAENYLKTLRLNGNARYTLDAYRLRGKDKDRVDARGCFIWDIYVKETGEFAMPQVANIQPPEIVQVGTVTKDYLDKQLELQRKEIIADFLEKELQRREKLLEEEQREWNRVKNDAIEIGLQKLGTILPKIMPEMQKVAGTQPKIIKMNTTNEMPESERDTEPEVCDVSREVENLLERWATVDNDWFEWLGNIVKLAETNPQKYNMAKTFL